MSSELAKLVGELREIITKLEDVVDKNCLNCEHWNETYEVCRKANAKPPTRIIIRGCEQFSSDIPF